MKSGIPHIVPARPFVLSQQKLRGNYGNLRVPPPKETEKPRSE